MSFSFKADFNLFDLFEKLENEYLMKFSSVILLLPLFICVFDTNGFQMIPSDMSFSFKADFNLFDLFEKLENEYLMKFS